MRLVQTVGYLAHCETYPTSIVLNAPPAKAGGFKFVD